MKIKKFFSNLGLKEPVIFNDDINFVLSYGHSVGKTVLLKALDYCLLKKDFPFKKISIFSREDLFFVIELENFGDFILIKRYPNKKRGIFIHVSDKEIDIMLEDDDFEHKNLGVDNAKDLLNEILSLTLNNTPVSNFRKYLSYFLRTQDDQSDIFKLNKYSRSKDKNYKPVVADLLGIDGEIVRKKYEIEEEISHLSRDIEQLKIETGGTAKEKLEVEIRELTTIKEEKEKLYSEFNFYHEEDKKHKELVDEIEQQIAALNEAKSYILRELNYIKNAIKTNFIIDIKELESFFKEMEITFPNDLKKNYENVIEFNKILTQDRKRILEENRREFQKKLTEINKELERLNSERQSIISILIDKDSFSKFKKLEKEIIDLESKINLEKEKLKKIEKFKQIIEQKEDLEVALKNTIKQISEMLDKVNKGEFQEIIKRFTKIIFQENGMFVVYLNSKNNLEFELKVAKNDDFNNIKEEGHTYRKLLSFIFSLAVLIYHKNERFFRFLAIDSPFDGDKTDYQAGLFEAIRIAYEEYGLQVILTTIYDEIKDDDMRKAANSHKTIFIDDDKKLFGNF